MRRLKELKRRQIGCLGCPSDTKDPDNWDWDNWENWPEEDKREFPIEEEKEMRKLRKQEKRVTECNNLFIDRWHDTMEVLPDCDNVWFISDGKICVGLYEPEQQIFCMADGMGVELKNVRQWKYLNVDKVIAKYPDERQIVAAEVKGLPCAVTGIFSSHCEDDRTGEDFKGLVVDEEYCFEGCEECDTIKWENVFGWYPLPEEPIKIQEPVGDSVVAVMPAAEEVIEVTPEETFEAVTEELPCDSPVCEECPECCPECEAPVEDNNLVSSAIVKANAENPVENNEVVDDPIKKAGLVESKLNESTENDKVRDWYVKTYPTDDMGPDIRPEITFYDVFDCLDNYQDVYDCLGVTDSVVRERVFTELADIMEVDYEYIYDQWLRTKDYPWKRESNKSNGKRVRESNGFYCGVPGVRMIWHGEWADPEIEYKGKLYSYTDMEDTLLGFYRDEHPEDENDDGFADWVRNNPDDVYYVLNEMDPTEDSNYSVDESKESTEKKLQESRINFVSITGKRNGYSPDQCGRTLTVGELISELENYDYDAPVYLNNDGGYTYGSITEYDICDDEYNDGEDEEEVEEESKKSSENKLTERRDAVGLHNVSDPYYKCYKALTDKIGEDLALLQIIELIQPREIESAIYEVSQANDVFFNYEDFEEKFGSLDESKKSVGKKMNENIVLDDEGNIDFEKSSITDEEKRAIIDYLRASREEAELLPDVPHVVIESKESDEGKLEESKKVLKEGDHVKYMGKKYTIESFLENNKVKISNESGEEVIVESSEIKDCTHSRMNEAVGDSIIYPEKNAEDFPEEGVSEIDSEDEDEWEYADPIEDPRFVEDPIDDANYPLSRNTDYGKLDFSWLPDDLPEQVNGYLESIKK